VKLLSAPARSAVGDRIAETLTNVPVVRETLEHPYYDGLRFMISARSSAGDVTPLIDGGAFDWLGKLTSNRRLALVASGMGAQLAAQLFRA